MAYVKAPIPTEVYHLMQLDKLDGILNDGKKSGALAIRNAGSAKALKK